MSTHCRGPTSASAVKHRQIKTCVITKKPRPRRHRIVFTPAGSCARRGLTVTAGAPKVGQRSFQVVMTPLQARRQMRVAGTGLRAVARWRVKLRMFSQYRHFIVRVDAQHHETPRDHVADQYLPGGPACPGLACQALFAELIRTTSRPGAPVTQHDPLQSRPRGARWATLQRRQALLPLGTPPHRHRTIISSRDCAIIWCQRIASSSLTGIRARINRFYVEP